MGVLNQPFKLLSIWGNSLKLLLQMFAEDLDDYVIAGATVSSTRTLALAFHFGRKLFKSSWNLVQP